MAGEFDEIRSRLEGIADELADLAIVRLRESIDAGGHELPVDEKRLTRARRGPTWREAVLMHAIGRIAYDGSIPNIQASWVKLGAQGVQQLLRAGVNDLGGTLMDESISRAAGAAHGQGMEEDGFRAIVEPLGRTLEQRTTVYDRVTPVSA